jgi:hypothetical protein
MVTPWANALRGTNIARAIALARMADDFLIALAPLDRECTNVWELPWLPVVDHEPWLGSFGNLSGKGEAFFEGHRVG